MSETVLPSIDDVGNKLVATYSFDSNTPVSVVTDLELSLNHVIRNNDPHLIVLDIKNGEPAWLASLLGKFAYMGIKLIVDPIADASKQTADALKTVQGDGTQVVASSLGYKV